MFGRTTRAERLSALIQRHGALAVLLVVVAVASVTSSTFPTWSNISSILGNNAFVWLLALGMTFVIITGGIDLSVGSMYALGGVLAADGSPGRLLGGAPAAAGRLRRVGRAPGTAGRPGRDGAVHRHAWPDCSARAACCRRITDEGVDHLPGPRALGRPGRWARAPGRRC